MMMMMMSVDGPWEARGQMLGVGLAQWRLFGFLPELLVLVLVLVRRRLDRRTMLVVARRAEKIQGEAVGRHGQSTIKGGKRSAIQSKPSDLLAEISMKGNGASLQLSMFLPMDRWPPPGSGRSRARSPRNRQILGLTRLTRDRATDDVGGSPRSVGKRRDPSINKSSSTNGKARQPVQPVP